MLAPVKPLRNGLHAASGCHHVFEFVGVSPATGGPQQSMQCGSILCVVDRFPAKQVDDTLVQPSLCCQIE